MHVPAATPTCRRLGIVALATGLLLAACGTPEPPTEQRPTRDVAAPPSAPVAQTPGVPTVIVIDASGSMATEDAPGQRLEAAKEAVSDVLGSLPPGQEVGLVIYGTATGGTPDEQVDGCRDVLVALPVIPVKARLIASTLAPLQPSGFTPIGASLEAAAAELPDQGPRSIIVLSDGVDTCAPDGLGPDPCEVANELHATDPELRIDTIGFRSADEAGTDDQLACIAAAGGGEHRPAADGSALAAALATALADR